MALYARLAAIVCLGGLAVAMVPYAVSLWDWEAMVLNERIGSEVKETKAPPAQLIDGCDVISPSEELQRKAEFEGIDKVRDEFLKELNRELRQMSFSGEVSLSSDGRSAKVYAANSVMRWIAAWASAESRAIYRSKEVPEDFETLVWRLLIDAAIRSKRIESEGLAQIEYARDIQLENPEVVPRSRDLKRIYFREAGMKMIVQGCEMLNQAAFVRLADLAKIAGRKDLLRQVYGVYGQPLPMWNQHFQRVGELKNVDEFWNYDAPLYERWYGVPKPIVVAPKPVRPRVPVTEEEQRAIRALYFALLDARIVSDRRKILSLSADADLAQVEMKLDKDLASSRLYSYDLTNARFEFWREKEDGPIEFKVEDMKLERDMGGQRKQVNARKTMEVVYVDGSPKFLFLSKKN